MVVQEYARPESRGDGPGTGNGAARPALLAPGRARAELGLERADFEVAVQLGHIRTATGPNGRRMVPRAELSRLRAEEGFPDTLRDRSRLVGTITGAELMGVSRDRFAKLAKLGCFRPARWYANRYRAVVWLYPASEVGEFARTREGWLKGRLPEEARAFLDGGGDRRAEGWRSRCVERLVAEASDAWQAAAVWSALLGPDEMADLVPDPDEYACLRHLMPALPVARFGSSATGDDAPPVSPLAEEADEIAFARMSLADALGRARAQRTAPDGGEHVEPPGERGMRGRTPEPGAVTATPRPHRPTPPISPGGQTAVDAPTATRRSGLRRWLRRGEPVAGSRPAVRWPGPRCRSQGSPVAQR